MGMKLRVRKTLLAVFSLTLAITTYCELSGLAMAQKKYKEPRGTCADLQKIANRIGKTKAEKYTFQGFENLPMRTDVYSAGVTPRGTDRLCQLGYFSQTTPMGKQICQGYIYTNTESSRLSWGIGYFRKTFYDPENPSSEFCRYVN
jgi:hypothetical protein